MLEGKPISSDDFCKNSKTYYSPGGAYKLYRRTAEGRTIRAEDVGWSAAAHHAYRKLIFPDGYPEDAPVVKDENPTAPAVAELDARVIAHVPSLEPARTFPAASSMEKRKLQESVAARAWSRIAVSPMRQLDPRPKFDPSRREFHRVLAAFQGIFAAALMPQREVFRQGVG